MRGRTTAARLIYRCGYKFLVTEYHSREVDSLLFLLQRMPY